MPVPKAMEQHTFIDEEWKCEFPVRIDQLPGKGRCAFAKRDIQAGEAVLRAKPYVAIPDSENKHRVCIGCMKKPSPDTPDLSISCDGCRQVSYCSDECRSKDEPLHRLECSFLHQWFHVDSPLEWNASRLGPYTVDYLWVLMRSLARRYYEKTTDSSFVTSDGLSFDHVWSLCSNSDDFSLERRQEFQLGSKALLAFQKNLSLSKADPLATVESLFELICKEECNSFGLYTYPDRNGARTSYGLAIYPMAVYFNHACDPNVVHQTDGVNEMFYASRFIPAGEELTITYISLRQAVDERQQELQKVFLFTCGCRRCVEQDEKSEELVRHRLCHRTGCHGSYLPTNEEGSFGARPGSDTSRLQWICESCQQARP